MASRAALNSWPGCQFGHKSLPSDIQEHRGDEGALLHRAIEHEILAVLIRGGVVVVRCIGSLNVISPTLGPPAVGPSVLEVQRRYTGLREREVVAAEEESFLWLSIRHERQLKFSCPRTNEQSQLTSFLTLYDDVVGFAP